MDYFIQKYCLLSSLPIILFPNTPRSVMLANTASSFFPYLFFSLHSSLDLDITGREQYGLTFSCRMSTLSHLEGKRTVRNK